MESPLRERDLSSSSSSSDEETETDSGQLRYEEETKQNYPPPVDPSTILVPEVVEGQTLPEQKEAVTDENVSLQADKPSVSMQHSEPSPSESMGVGAKILEFDVSADSGEVTEEDGSSTRDKSIDPQSIKAPILEDSKPSSSIMDVEAQPRHTGGFVEIEYLDPTAIEGNYVKKGFTCDNTMDEEDEQLREYWTRALQTSTSTGEVVEEIVKVLKHHQKTHDLMCPVCGSCVTRRVILRKRKRSSFMSVDRWYQDRLEDEAEVPLQDTSLEAIEERETQEYQDTEAFGCLACFSLFYEKGRQLFNRLQAEVGPDTFNCLPFFFPPYPWGMTQRKTKSPGFRELEESEVFDMREPLITEPDLTCGIGSTLLPEYPWGTMPSLSKGVQEELSGFQELEESEVFDMREPLTTDMTTDMKPDFTCGIGSTLLPEYPWGAMPSLSKGEVGEASLQTEAGMEVSDTMDEEQAVAQTDDIDQPFTERTCTCELAPALLPAYPWGVCTKAEGGQVQGTMDAGALPLPQSVLLTQGEGPRTSTCTCELTQALLPDYPWGYMSKYEEDTNSTQVQDTIMQLEAEEAPQLHRTERSCTCGIVPALLPDYPWGYFVKDQGDAYTSESRIEPGVEAVEVNERSEEEDGLSCNLVSAVLPDYPWGITAQSEDHVEVPLLQKRSTKRREKFFKSSNPMLGLEGVSSACLPPYPWGTCSAKQSLHDQSGGAQMHKGQAGAIDAGERDCTCGLGSAMLPKFPWGQSLSPGVQNIQPGSNEVKNYIEQEMRIETRITSKTDVFTVTTSKKTYPGEKPPEKIKTMVPQKSSQTIQSVTLDQRVTVVNASIEVDEVPGVKGGAPLASLPSTGFALLDLVNEGLPEKGRLETRPSTGYAYLEELSEDAAPIGKGAIKMEKEYKDDVTEISEIEEDPGFIKYSQSEAKLESHVQPIPEETFYKYDKTKPQVSPIGMQFPSFQWSVEKLDTGDLTMPLLKTSIEPEAETFISVLKPSPGGADEAKSESWLSVIKVSKPHDEEGITAPLLSTKTGYKEEIQEEIQPVRRPQLQTVPDAVINIPPSDSAGASVGTLAASAVAVPAKKIKDADEWNILKCIVYGGLDISIASLGVTSAAAGGNAITRTVVYMGLATLVSGLFEFYHNVLNLYHYHRDHYTDVVGLSLLLHGTVALISYVVFGALSPLIYALSYRKTDDRDDKFILCCGVTVVTVTALALGKAKVSNKRYLRALSAYILGGVLAAITGYLAGEHVSELLEEWGL